MHTLRKLSPNQAEALETDTALQDDICLVGASEIPISVENPLKVNATANLYQPEHPFGHLGRRNGSDASRTSTTSSSSTSSSPTYSIPTTSPTLSSSFSPSSSVRSRNEFESATAVIPPGPYLGYHRERRASLPLPPVTPLEHPRPAPLPPNGATSNVDYGLGNPAEVGKNKQSVVHDAEQPVGVTADVVSATRPQYRRRKSIDSYVRDAGQEESASVRSLRRMQAYHRDTASLHERSWFME